MIDVRDRDRIERGSNVGQRALVAGARILKIKRRTVASINACADRPDATRLGQGRVILSGDAAAEGRRDCRCNDQSTA
jgi:hypothetical protein